MANRSRTEKKGNKPKLSTESQQQAQTSVDRVVPVSFSKQQRKEVQQAIEKGMKDLRSQTSSKNRERDKKLKQLQKQLAAQQSTATDNRDQEPKQSLLKTGAPWLLLALSWLGFALFLLTN